MHDIMKLPVGNEKWGGTIIQRASNLYQKYHCVMIFRKFSRTYFRFNKSLFLCECYALNKYEHY